MATKLPKLFLLLSLLLLILGTGNIYVGQQRAEYYEKLQKEYALQGNAGATDSEKNFQYLEARHGFYRFCILGGKCFLAGAAFFMICAFVLLPREEDKKQEVSEQCS